MKQLISILLLGTIISIQAKEGHHHKKRHHKAHEHGSGKLNLVTENNNLIIEIEAPANDIVGFEHKPKTKSQKEKINSAVNILKEVKSNIELPKVAKCKLTKDAKIESEIIKKEHKEKGHHDHEKHSEFHITYQFTCANIEKLNSVNVLSFKNFKEMKKLKANGITQNGQFSQVLNKNSQTFSLRK